MKFLIVLLLSLSLNAFASGKIVLKPYYNSTLKKADVAVGLSVYEKLFSKVALNSWSGFGETKETAEKFFVFKNAIDIQVKDFTISPGFQLEFLDTKRMDKTEIFFLSVAYKLWN
jgi:hypothetical protein